MTNKSGIYRITNIVNWNKYIGSAVNFKRRWSQHRSDLNKNIHCSEHLQNAWNKYGADCFGFSIIEYCQTNQLLEREQYYIDCEKPAYNICLIAGSRWGIKHTEDSKQHMSEAHKGHFHTEEQKRKISEAGKGHICSEESKRKMSEAKIGKHKTEEAKQRMSEAKTGEQHPLFGKHHSEETKQKMSEAHKGEQNPNFAKQASEETKRKMSEAHRRRWVKRKQTLDFL